MSCAVLVIGKCNQTLPQHPTAAPRPGRVVWPKDRAEHLPAFPSKEGPRDRQVARRIAHARGPEVDDGAQPAPLDQQVPGSYVAKEADMFLWLAELGECWRARPSGCGGIVSLLYEPCNRMRSVALDPPPKKISDGTIGLVSLERDRCVDYLLGRKSG